MHLGRRQSALALLGDQFRRSDSSVRARFFGGILSGDYDLRTRLGELRGVMERDKAPLGVLITLRDPTGP